MTTSRLPDADPAGQQLDDFNELAVEVACAELLGCCRVPHWARAVAAGRPYQTVDELLARSDAAVAALTRAELAEALAGHPRIGDRAVLAGPDQPVPAPRGPAPAEGRPVAPAGGSSRREQSGVAAASAEVLQALAEGNAEYERRFGHIYLACAAGRTGAELLALLRRRLANDPETEWRAVAAELAKINRIRLRAMLAAQP
jgi:2-oxo-4-hydroxy-4-carboxy-5-ureidoimidazoline decarboxylase